MLVFFMTFDHFCEIKVLNSSHYMHCVAGGVLRLLELVGLFREVAVLRRAHVVQDSATGAHGFAPCRVKLNTSRGLDSALYLSHWLENLHNLFF